MADVEVFTVERFMLEIQSYECLYNKFCRDFKDKYKKINGWTKVGQKFGMSAEEAEKKFKLLRSDFTRYQRRMMSLPSGSGRDAAVRAEKYECFQWLLPYIDHRKTTTNFPQQLHILNNSTNYPCSYSTSRRSPSSNSTTTSNSLDNEDENRDEVLVTGLTESSIIVEDEESNVLEKASDDEKASGLSQVQSGDVGTDKRPWCKSNRKRAKMTEVDNAILRSAESLYRLSNEFDNKQRNKVDDEDANSLFCRSLTTRLRRLPGNVKAYVRVQIEQFFYQAETSTFQPSSGVQNTSPSIIRANTASEQGQSMQSQYFVLD